VISSHYATDGEETGAGRAERDAANNARLLREMEGVPDGERTARFVCVMVLAGPLHLLPTSGTGVSPVRARPNLKRRKRNLPHWERDGATYAISFRVARGQLSELERRIVM